MKWNTHEEQLLVDLYPSTPSFDLSTMLERTKTSIQSKAHRMGLKNPDPPTTPTAKIHRTLRKTVQRHHPTRPKNTQQRRGNKNLNNPTNTADPKNRKHKTHKPTYPRDSRQHRKNTHNPRKRPENDLQILIQAITPKTSASSKGKAATAKNKNKPQWRAGDVSCGSKTQPIYPTNHIPAPETHIMGTFMRQGYAHIFEGKCRSFPLMAGAE